MAEVVLPDMLNNAAPRILHIEDSLGPQHDDYLDSVPALRNERKGRCRAGDCKQRAAAVVR